MVDSVRRDTSPTQNAHDQEVTVHTELCTSMNIEFPIFAFTHCRDVVVAVSKAGGHIARTIFSFPGGRRFHFIDPGGNELAVWTPA